MVLFAQHQRNIFPVQRTLKNVSNCQHVPKNIIQKEQTYFLQCFNNANCNGLFSVQDITCRLSSVVYVKLVQIVEKKVEQQISREKDVEHAKTIEQLKQQTMDDMRVALCAQHMDERIIFGSLPSLRRTLGAP